MSSSCPTLRAACSPATAPCSRTPVRGVSASPHWSPGCPSPSPRSASSCWSRASATPTRSPEPSRPPSPSPTACRRWCRGGFSTGSARPSCCRSSSRCTPSGWSGWSSRSRPGGPSLWPSCRRSSPGLSYPPIGSAVRARWSYVLAGRPADVQTAYALESVIDEVIFVIGPTVATVLATQWHPWAGLALALISGVSGTLLLAAQRGSQPVPHAGSVVRSTARHAVDAGRHPGAVSFALGVAVRRGRGEHRRVLLRAARQAVAGVLLACWSAGSMLAGLITGTLAWRRSSIWPRPGRHGSPRPGDGADALSSARWLAMGVTLFLAGLRVAPTLIGSLRPPSSRGCPQARLTEGIAISHTGLAAGPGARRGLVGPGHRRPWRLAVVPRGAGRWRVAGPSPPSPCRPRSASPVARWAGRASSGAVGGTRCSTATAGS